MITGELKNKIDSLWDIFAAGGLVNPLDVIEQITYLMFIHDLDDSDNRRAKEAAMLGLPYQSIFADEVQIGERTVDGRQLKWSVFHDFPAAQMYTVVQESVFPFIKNLHGDKNSAYSKYMDDAIFKLPTPLLLSKVVDALDEIYRLMSGSQAADVRGDTYEYLLSKISQSGLNGQFRTPRHIIRMMVELMDPKADDVICDPACGTSGFLVSAGEYLKERRKKEIFFNRQKKDHYMNHKDKFYIFDFCGNFEFFRMSKGKPTANTIALQGAIFHLKAQIVYKLQDLAYQTEELIAFRKTLVDDMVRKVRELNRENFAVRQHLKYVELYADPKSYNALTYEDTLLIGQELAPLITPEEDDAKALRFDALLYGIELAYLAGKTYGKARSDLFKKVSAVASVANIPEIAAQSELIDKILHTDYVERAGINEFEHIRKSLRDLIKYIPFDGAIYTTNFADEILSVDWKGSELENDDLKNYKAKAEFYVRQHANDTAIAKLRGNIPLTSGDVEALERILWSEVGTKQDYEAEYGQKPLGEFVREIVGLDMNAAKEAFARYLNDASLDSRQIYFVNQIVEYIVRNGMMKDLSVLQEAPFTDYGSIVEVFTDLSVWAGIRQTIEKINANAAAA